MRFFTTDRCAEIALVAWALGLVTAAEMLIRSAHTIAILATTSLAVSLGFLLSAAERILTALAARSSRTRLAGSLLIGALAAGYLVDRIGLIGQLGGRFQSAALISLAGVIVMSLFLAAMVFGHWFLEGDAQRARRGKRRAVAGVLMSLAIISYAANLVLHPDLYPPVHRFLEGTTVASFALTTVYLTRLSIAGARRVCLVGMASAVPVGVASWGHSWPSAVVSEALGSPISASMLRLGRNLSDWDRDGYSSLLGHGDCSALDPDIHPNQRDHRGGGDRNCKTHTAIPLAPRLGAPEPGEVVEGVILITVDSLRADRLTMYGGANDTSPELAKWASGACRFQHAYTSGGWTSLALPSLFYGLYPRRLSWTWLNETNKYRLTRSAEALESGESIRKVFGLPLSEQRPQLAKILSAAHVATAAVVDDGSSDYLNPRIGAFAGFNSYRHVDRLPADRQDDAGTTDLALEELSQLARTPRFFLWVHYFGPHSPTSWHPEVPRFGEGIAAAYDHEIRHTDSQLRRLLDGIERLQVSRKVAVIVTADHGEEIFERGRHHGLAVTDENIRIPMLVMVPGWSCKVAESSVSLVDVMPTTLRLLGQTVPADLDGSDLRAIEADESARGRSVIAETWRFDRRGRRVVDQIAVVSAGVSATFDLIDQAWLTGPPSRSVAAVAARYLDETGGPFLED